MSLVEFARKELEFAGYFKPHTAEDEPDEDMRRLADDMNAAMARDVLALIEVFSEQGHSGTSAGFCRQLFNKLAAFEPIRPLTGEPEEWTKLEYGSDITYQNKRCSHVFKDADGRAYDIDGIIFEDESGCRFTNRDSRVYIDFPYTPTRKIVRVDENRDPVE